jgi:hypothetical protein
MKSGRKPSEGSETYGRLERVADSRRLAPSRGLVGLVVIVLIVILLSRNSFRLGWPR